MHPVPQNESHRLAAVDAYQITNTPTETCYDDIAELAAQICECPVGVINIIGDTKEWLKAKYGLPPNLTFLPRGTVCSTAICQGELLTVNDLSRDSRFADHPAVKENPHFRFYSGMPLTNDEGYVLGTVCVFDFEPRELTHQQLDSLRRLSRQTMAHLELRRKDIELSGIRQALEAAESRSNDLLLNILPASIAEEFRTRDKVGPRHYDSASIMFTDFKGFNQLAEQFDPRILINDLDQFFSAFDQIISTYGLEKIRTIGDTYMCVGGAPLCNTTHVRDVCNAALDIQNYVTRVNRQRARMRLTPWELRIGLHTGPVIAGVVGKKKFTFDIWGDAVNTAACMERNGEVGRVVISDSIYRNISDEFNCDYRGTVEIKNKRTIKTYYLNSR